MSCDCSEQPIPVESGGPLENHSGRRHSAAITGLFNRRRTDARIYTGTSPRTDACSNSRPNADAHADSHVSITSYTVSATNSGIANRPWPHHNPGKPLLPIRPGRLSLFPVG